MIPPISYSSLSTFEQCPHKYYRTKIAKDIKEDFSGEAATWGNEVHKALEDYLRSGKALSEKFSRYEHYAKSLASVEGEKLVEEKLGITDDGQPVDFFSSDVAYRGVLDYMVIRPGGTEAFLIDHKGLDVDTRIPTPSGFVRMGDLSVGDEVFDKDGLVCRVTDKSQVKQIPCYRVTFNDGSSVVCDEEHLWYTDSGDVIGVHELMGRQGKTQRHAVPRIPVCGAVRYPESALPIHPYVLGFWLADGKISSSEVTKADDFMWGHVKELGYEVNQTPQPEGKCPTWTIKGIRAHLKALGLLGAEKRIPEAYLQASIGQRLQLLNGLMDGDGSANPVRKQCVYCTTNPALAQDVQQLLCSLGQQPYISPFEAHGFGVTTTAHYVYFRPNGINPFLTPIKAERVGSDWGAGWSGFRRAKSVEQVPIRQTQCIAVDSASNTYLCTERMIVTHNTGKVRPTKQLHFNALLVFHCFPNVERLRAAFFWLPADSYTKHEFRREELDDIWGQFERPLVGIEECAETNIWPKKKSGLCPWCPVHDCEFYNTAKRK